MNEVENDDPTKQPVLEVQGIFPDSSALRAAIDGLKQAGYVHADAVLPEDQDGPRPGADDSAPTEENHQQMRILTTSLAGSAGAVLVGIAVLASGAAIPLVAGAALVAGLGSGALMERVGHGVEQKQIDEYDRRGAAGTLVLAMRVKDRARADEVTRKSCAAAVRRR